VRAISVPEGWERTAIDVLYQDEKRSSRTTYALAMYLALPRVDYFTILGGFLLILREHLTLQLAVWEERLHE
jgi:hypothetical protein